MRRFIYGKKNEVHGWQQRCAGRTIQKRRPVRHFLGPVKLRIIMDIEIILYLRVYLNITHIQCGKLFNNLILKRICNGSFHG